MIFQLLFVVFILLLSWVYYRWRVVKNFWAKRNVPHEPPHPIVGSLTSMFEDNVAIWLRKTAERCRTPFVGVWFFWRPLLLINSPELARNILVKDADIFRDRFASPGKNDPTASYGLVFAKGQDWITVRKRLTPMFTSAKLRHVQNLAAAKAKELVQRINTDTNNKNFINLRSLCMDYTTDIIGTAAFGVDCNATLTTKSSIRSIAQNLTQFGIVRALAWICMFYLPEATDVFGFKAFPKESVTFFRKIFRAAVNQRGGYDRKVTEVQDLVDALVLMKQEAAKENEDLPEDMLLSQSIIFLIGGFDTSALTMSFTLYELAFNPSVQDKLYQELLAAKRTTDSEDIDLKHLTDVTYLICVVKETLRKYPPISWLEREGLKEYRVNENLTIPAGTPVYINTMGLHYDPEYFPNPYNYEPDRFLPENEGKIIPFTYLPFGEGPRGCIGRRFALQNIYFALSLIVLNFEIHPVPKSPKPGEFKVENRGITLAPDEPLSVEFIPRCN